MEGPDIAPEREVHLPFLKDQSRHQVARNESMVLLAGTQARPRGGRYGHFHFNRTLPERSKDLFRESSRLLAALITTTPVSLTAPGWRPRPNPSRRMQLSVSLRRPPCNERHLHGISRASWRMLTLQETLNIQRADLPQD